MRSEDRKIIRKAKELTPGADSKGHEWLNDFELNVENGMPAWGNFINGYVRGLWAAGVISLKDLDDFDGIQVEAGY